MQPLRIEIDPSPQGARFETEFTGTLEIGRQREHEPSAPMMTESASGPRLIAAQLNEVTVSRSHLQLKQIDDRNISVTNLTKHGPVRLEGDSVACGQSRQLSLPVNIPLGDHLVRVSSADEPPNVSLLRNAPLTAPETGVVWSAPEMSLADLQSVESVSPERILQWMHQVLDLFKEVAGTEKFYQSALTGVLQMLNLTSAAILFRDGEKWRIESAVFASENRGNAEWYPSTTILDMVRSTKNSFRQLPNDDSLAQSLSEVTSLVAAPIFDDQRNVIGAVYGDRRSSILSGESEITEIEALFVELISSGISTGLARIEQEKKSAAARTRFEQFFPPNLARRLEDDASFLEGKESEVSILFCDIRRFSEISERIGPRETVSWINGVMDALSACVLDHDGVLVDYIGDELLAMWGAPDDQPDHALLACQAALSMLDVLPSLNEQWRDRTGCDFGVGIGINSGRAQVGNIGSNVKFKYGPLGNSVNIASRIQNATKQLQTTAMVSESTQRMVGGKLAMRKLCQIRVVNVQEPFTVFELSDDQSQKYIEASHLYEQGLAAFEAGECLDACKHLTNLLARFPDDGPALILLSRAVNRLGSNSSQSDTVWNLSRK